MIIYRFKSHNKHEDVDFNENHDKEFMEECGKIDRDQPQTWKKYSNWDDILEMELAEYKKSHNVRELYHIAVACLNIWRKYK